VFQFVGLGVLFGGAKPLKAPRGDGTGPVQAKKQNLPILGKDNKSVCV